MNNPGQSKTKPVYEYRLVIERDSPFPTEIIPLKNGVEAVKIAESWDDKVSWANGRGRVEARMVGEWDVL